MNGFYINRKIRQWFSLTALISFGILLFAGTVLADCSVSFSWLPNTESNITGYRIYYGQTMGGPYTNMVDVGNPALVNERVTGIVSELVCDQQYYFVCVAVNDANIESDYSVEVPVKPDGVTEVEIGIVPGVQITN